MPEKLNVVVHGIAAIKHEQSDMFITRSIHSAGAGNTFFKIKEIKAHCQINTSTEYCRQRMGSQHYDMVDWEVFQDVSMAYKVLTSEVQLLALVSPTKQ